MNNCALNYKIWQEIDKIILTEGPLNFSGAFNHISQTSLVDGVGSFAVEMVQVSSCDLN